jgi:DNA-binding PucR family transcriptional regulator
MSLKVSDLMKLPCFGQAGVIAGRKGLNKTVSSVSVLEYSFADDLQEDMLSSIAFLGGELVISCFAAARNDVWAQCATIRRLAAVGEIGIVLFYVGIILREVHEDLIKLADELEFPIILMPKGRRELRYSEVISDVMFALFQDQMTERQFKDDILERISRLPFYQRSVNTVLRMLSDRTKATLILADGSGGLLNVACYPSSLEIDAGQVIAGGDYAARRTIHTTIGSRLELYALTPGGSIDADAASQIADVIRLSVNLWSKSHSEKVLPELVKAILQDEPVKMLRIAEAFKIDVRSIHNMWLITPLEGDVRAFQAILAMLKDELSPLCKTIVADIYNQDIAAFLDTPLDCDLPSVAEELSNAMAEAGIPAVLTWGLNLTDTAHVRRVYLQAQNALPTARAIFPSKRVFSQHDISFADNCREIIEQGEDAVHNYTALLDCLVSDDPAYKADLLETLTVYLLDAESDIQKCAKLLYVHMNSVKYRLNRINRRLGFHIGKLPETLELYTAAALKRLFVKIDK